MSVQDFAVQLGEIRGKQRAMETNLSEIKDDLRDQGQRLARMEGSQAHIADAIEDLKKLMTDSRKHRVIVPAATVSDAAGPWGIGLAVVRHPATPMGLALVAVTVMAIVTLSAITDRKWSDITPGAATDATPASTPGQ